MRLKNKITFIIAFCLLFISCIPNEYDNDIIDCRIYIESITPYNDFSRGNIIFNTGFNEGDTILFNSFGAHTNINNMLTYNGSSWSSDKDLKWNPESNDSLTFTAIYPTTSNCRYTKNEIYKDGSLKDILFCKSQSKFKEKINLKLNHLFSLLKIDLTNISEDSIKSITVTIPATIDSIGVNSGIIYINQKDSISYTAISDSNRVLILVVPPIDNLSINLKININDKVVEKVIKPINYEAGYIYTCSIIPAYKSMSIKSAEDFIAFTNLINNKPYGQRTLDEFYYMENGHRVFSLANNIYFTQSECNKLNAIGTKTENYNDIFDGKGNSLYNLHFSITASGKGLFGYIGLSGIVKNINILNSSIIFSGAYEGSLLVCRNYGLIDNCVLDSCRMETVAYNGASLVSFYQNGTIVNSRVSNSVIVCGEKGANSIFTKSLSGKILNCCLANNLITYSSSAEMGELACYVNSGSQISNCYVKNSNKQTKSVYKFAYTLESNSTLTNCFTYSNVSLWYSNKGSVNYYTYDANFKIINDNREVITMLNQWIDDNQQYYSDFQFKKWIRNTTTIPAIYL